MHLKTILLIAVCSFSFLFTSCQNRSSDIVSIDTLPADLLATDLSPADQTASTDPLVRTTPENEPAIMIPEPAGLIQYRGNVPGSRILRWYTADPQNVLFRIVNGNDSGYDSAYTEYQPVQTYIETIRTYAYTVEITGLTEDTIYQYWLVDEQDQSQVSRMGTLTVQEAGDSFSFLFAGDPQISAFDPDNELLRFNRSVDFGCSISPPSFLILAGDQVDDSSNAALYQTLASAPSLRNMPVLVNQGNHDRGDVFNDYYYMPDITPEGNYYYTYGDVLFVALNSNYEDYELQQQYIKEIVSHHRKKWLIVTMHHPLYGISIDHVNDSKTADLRNAFAQLFSELDVDIVLSGHEHSFARTGLMEGLVSVGDTDANMLEKAVKQKGQLVYLDVNSSSGSKYYHTIDAIPENIAAFDQQGHPNITVVQVSQNQITLETYDTETRKLLDSFTLMK